MSGSASVTFTAGTSISLEPGFHATAGTGNPTFRAFIGTPLRITTAPTLPAGKINAAYAGGTLAVTGLTGQAAWAITGGGLPAGMNLATSGTISGTPTAGGTFGVTIQVTDSAGPATSQAFSLNVLAVGTPSLPNGILGQSYGPVSLAAIGGSGTYSWSISGLPPGLGGSAGGSISGTPTATGNFSVGATVSDSVSGLSVLKAFPLNVGGVSLSVVTSALPPGVVNQAYSPVTLTATGGTGTGYTWSATSLPPGLTLTSGGVLGGTPTTATGSPFMGAFSVTDSANNSTSRSLAITVGAAGSAGSCPATGCKEYIRLGGRLVAVETRGTVSISPGSLSNATTGIFYTQTFTATGGVPSYTFSISSGTIPSGMTFSTGGVLSGTPTATGTYSFTINALDSGGNPGTLPVTLLVVSGVPTLTSSVTPPSGSSIVGNATTFTFSASDSLGPNRSGVYSYLWFTPSLYGGTANSCLLQYEVATHVMSLAGDGGSYTSAGAVPSATTLTNSQCSVSLASANVNLTSTTVSVSVSITFTSTFAGTKTMFTNIFDNGYQLYWPQSGPWRNVGWAATATPVNGTSAAGQYQTFQFSAVDPNGAGGSGVFTYLWFAPSLGSAANSCLLRYQPSTNTLWLYDNSGNPNSSGTLPGSGVLSNSQCSVDLTGASRVLSGYDVSVSVPVQFSAAYAGQKTIYADIYDSGFDLYWPSSGIWTIQ